MRSRAFPLLVVSFLVAAAVAPRAQQLRKIGEMELALVGLSATVDGARPAIPKNVASGVKILISGGGAALTPGAVARLIGDFSVEAEISGPSFGETTTIRAAITAGMTASDLILPLPVMPISGEHTLSNLRIVSGGRPVLDLQPHTVPIDVVEQVLITSVRTRPLTLQEIKDKGIVLDSDDYLGFEFTLGILLESKPVNIAFPVVFDRAGVAVPLPQSLPSLRVDDVQAPVIVPKVVPVMMKIPKIGAGSGITFSEEEIRIPSVLVIPGEVGYLKQFFSAQLFVGNGTPATANLIVKNLRGTIELPKGLDATAGTPDDPLSLAETANGIQPLTMTIAGVGADGTPGTADDETSLRPGQQGQAEFLVRGDLEGFHNLAFDIVGTLEGLPTGPIEVTGRATGGVLVRNPFFDVTFTLPTVVRANEPFRLYATVTNKGQGLANDVSMSLDSAALSGVRPIGDTTRTIATLKPGEAETLSFDFEALRTGQAVATYLRFEGPGATGSLKFKIGVGERGVPLSPDTLVLPSQVDELPVDVITSAMRVLGQAWSIANTPPNAMPPGVVRISKQAVTNKALSLAEAGLRIRLGQPEGAAIRDLLQDFYGPAPIDRGFDQLLRTTDAGRQFNAAVGAALATFAVPDAIAFESAFADVAASGKDVISFAIANGGDSPRVNVRLTDAAGRATVFTGDSGDPRPAVASAAIAPLGAPQEAPIFGIIAAPTAGPYTLELTGRDATAIDVSFTYPRGDGSFTRATAAGVPLGLNGKARVAIDAARASPAIEIDTDGDGTFDSSTPLQLSSVSASGPRLVSVSVVGPETFDSAGPFGFSVAMLFDRPVDESAAADLTRYSIPDNAVISARRQLSGRFIFGALAMPEGPYIPSSMTVANMPDLRGATVGIETRPLVSLLEAPGAVISGRVINGDGQLAAGIRVIYSGNGAWKDCDGQSRTNFSAATTDAQGRYQFRYVYRDKCGWAWGMRALDDINHSERSVYGAVRAPGERITADIALLGRGAVTGVVRDFAGAPVAGAQVIAISSLESQVGGSALTDGDGRYTIFNITVGPVTVKAAKGASVGTAAAQIARAGTAATADVTLNSGTVSVSGLIEAVENGVRAPAAGAIVVFEARSPLASSYVAAGAATTGADGRYAFTAMPAGSYILTATLPNTDRASINGTTSVGDVLTDLNVLVPVVRNASISGVVRYPDGSIAPRAVVTVSSRGAVAEEDGTFVVDGVAVSANPQTINAYSSDGLREGRTTALVNQSGQQLTGVVVTLNGIGTLDLVVIDSAGNPVRNQIVQISRTGTNVSPTDCTAFYLATTDNAGHVQFAGLDVGAVRVVSIRQTLNGVDIATLNTAIPHEGATVNGVLKFGGGGIVRGTVRDDLGNPVFGANIEIYSKIYNSGLCQLVPGVSHRLRTDLSGQYRVTGVPVGNVNLSASQEFFPTPVGKSGVLARDGDELVFDVQLVHTTAGTLSGRVFLPDGVTPAGAGVTVSAIGALPEVLVSTNADGEFHFAKIFPAGNYRVTVRDSLTGGIVQEIVALSAGADVRHDFRMKGRGTVRVKVVDGGGVAAANALVTLKETGFPNETFEAVVEPSNEGVVTFMNVHEGDFSVSASDPFGRGGRVNAEVPAPDATVDVTVRMTVTGTVSGRFLMPDDSPIPFGAVKLLSGGKVIGQTTTESGDATGSFSFSYVPAGTVTLDALDPATGRSGIAVGQITTDGQQLVLDVRAKGLGTVTGTIRSNGVAQAGAHVSVSSGAFKAEANADQNGVFAVPGVPEGAITVKADLLGALPSSATGTLTGDGATVTIDVNLQASGSVVGTIVSSDGVTAAPPSIVTLTGPGIRLTSTTNVLGEYRFDLVPAGTRTITVDVIGSIDTATVAAIVAGGQTTTVPIQLNGVGTITGDARNSFGLPVDGTVTLTGTGALSWSTTLTVTPDGTFTAAQVLAGPFSAQVRHSAGSITLYGTTTGVVLPAQTTHVVVTLQSTGDVHGTVMRADGVTPATGAVVKLLQNGAVKGTTQAFTNGEFSFTGLPLAVYSVTVYDSVSNGYARALNLTLAANGDVAEAGTLTLDDTGPVVQSITPADGATGVSRTQPIVITFSDPLSNTGGVNVKKGATAVSHSRTLSADGRTMTATGTWPDSAEVTIEVTTGVTDVFGRHPAAIVTSKFVTVDTSAPVVTAVSPLDDALQVAAATTIVATFSEPLANSDVSALIALSRDGAAVAGTAVLGPSNVVTFTPSAPLAGDGRYTIRIDGAIDATGNEQGAAFTSSFATNDTVAPVLAITSPSLTLWTKDATPSIVVSRSDATSGIDISSGTMTLDGASVTPGKFSTSMSYTVPATAPLADGTHSITAASADRAGNSNTVAGTFMLDATAPSTAALTSPVAGAAVAGQTAVAATATDATSGVARIEIRIDGGGVVTNLLPPSFTGTWNASSTPEGPHTLTATAYDVAGNAGAASAPVSIMVDNDPLTVSITSPPANFRTRKPVTVTATVSEPVQRVDFTLGGTTVTDTTSPYSAVLPIAALPDGNATITVQAVDLFGAVVTQTRVIVVDRTSPVARWAFDEGAGATTADATGNGHTGTLVNGAAWSALGQFGKAITFDGVDDGVTAADHDDFDITDAVSMSAWVLPSATGTVQTLIEKSGHVAAYSLAIGPDGRAEAVVLANGSTVVVQSVEQLPQQLWSHLAATYDGTTLTLFVNGAPVASTSASGVLPVTDGAIWLGRSEAGNVLNGRLDEVRIYDRALSPAEVTALAAASAPKTLLAAGYRATFVAQPGGSAWAFGQHNLGSLGLGSAGSNVVVPAAVAGISDLANIAYDNNHGVALTRAGVLYGWGYTYTYGMGDGTTSNRTVPTVIALDNVVQVAAGTFHSGAVLANGDAYTWGDNTSGELGDGTTSTSLVPKRVMTGVRAIAMSGNTTLFLKADGTVWGAGANSSGQLGTGTTASIVMTPVQMTGITNAVAIGTGDAHSIVLLADGTLRGVGAGSRTGDGTATGRLTTVPVVGMSGVVQISVNGGFTLARKADGTVWGWGVNNSGELADGTTTTRPTPQRVQGLSDITDIGTGNDQAIAVSATGVVYTWGTNGFGELGDGTTRNRLFVAPISDDNYVWKVPTPQMGTLTGTFNNDFSVTITNAMTTSVTMHYTRDGVEPTEADPVVAHNTALLINASQTLKVKAFKSGMTPSNTATEVYTMKVFTPSISPNTSSPFTAAQNNVTMNDFTTGATIRYTLLPGTTFPDDPTEASAQYSTALSIATQSRVKARAFRAGYSPSDITQAQFNFAYPGLPASTISPNAGTFTGSVDVTLSAAFMPPGTTFRYSTTSNLSSCSSGTLYTGPITLTSTTTLRALTCNVDYTTPAQSTAVFTIKATAPTISLPSGSYAPGTTTTINISPPAGAPASTIYISIDGTDPSATSFHPSVPSGHTMLAGTFTLKARAVRANALDSDVVSATYTLNAPMSGGSIAEGDAFLLMATPNGRLIGWGWNGNGQMGLIGTGGSFQAVPTIIHDLTGVVAASGGSAHSLALTYDGRVFASGQNNVGQVGDGTNTNRSRYVPIMSNVVAISSGSQFNLALTSSGQVYAWGSNSNGQLGNGTTTGSSTPILVSGLPSIAAIAAGHNYSVALTTTGQVYAWGANGTGNLGDGTTTQRTTPTLITSLSGVDQIAATHFGSNLRTFARLNNGKVFATGSGQNGSLGFGNTSNRTTFGELTHSPYAALFAGITTTGALRLDGALVGWGANNFGQIGDGTATQRLTPTASLLPLNPSTFGFDDTSWAVMPSGDVYVWGEGNIGQLGNNTSGTNLARLTPAVSFTVAEPWAPAPPTFSAAPGTYSNSVTLVVSTPMAGATIRYTTDGSTPTDGSLEVPANGEILINQSMTVRARVFAPGRFPSAVTAGAYVITP